MKAPYAQQIFRLWTLGFGPWTPSVRPFMRLNSTKFDFIFTAPARTLSWQRDFGPTTSHLVELELPRRVRQPDPAALRH